MMQSIPNRFESPIPSIHFSVNRSALSFPNNSGERTE
jgi:hypothetical protein